MSEASTPVQAIIDLWPKLSDFASDAGIETNSAKQMRRRSSINVAYWPGIIAGAARRSIGGVSWETLGVAHAVKPSETVAAA